jgi:putative transcriptional regulator
MLATLAHGPTRADAREARRVRGALDPRGGAGASLKRMLEESLAGQLLLASPSLLDPNFVRTVVLIGVHSEDGAMGVVLNRPSTVTIGEAVPQLQDAVGALEPVYVGGPVQSSSVVFLAEFLDPSPAGLLVLGRIGFPAPDAGLDELADATARRRVFAGHAGWGRGQLDAEVADGDWITDAAHPEDVFTDVPEELWTSVLRRKGGSYALIARMPLDPSVN